MRGCTFSQNPRKRGKNKQTNKKPTTTYKIPRLAGNVKYNTMQQHTTYSLLEKEDKNQDTVEGKMVVFGYRFQYIQSPKSRLWFLAVKKKKNVGV